MPRGKAVFYMFVQENDYVIRKTQHVISRSLRRICSQKIMSDIYFVNKSGYKTFGESDNVTK